MSVTAIEVTVTLPVFFTTKEYETVSPALDTVVGDADFDTVRAGAAVAVTVADEAAEVTWAPPGVVPEAVAESAIDPLSISAWVAVYDAVHVVEAPGARVVTGQVTVTAVAGAVAESVTEIADTVTLPVFVTRKEYDTVWPAAVTVAGEADFTTVSAGAAVAVTVAVEGVDVTAVPPGVTPDAVAESLIDPASTSACVAT